jgi:hypothetical protein
MIEMRTLAIGAIGLVLSTYSRQDLRSSQEKARLANKATFRP